MTSRFMPQGYVKLEEAIEQILKSEGTRSDAEHPEKNPQHPLWQTLYAGQLSCFLLSGDGHLRELPTHIWGDWEFQSRASRLFPPVDFGGDIGWVTGRPLLRVRDFTAFLQRDAADRITPTVDLPDPLPPYVAFMLRAVRDLELQAGKRVSKAKIRHYLEENCPKDLPLSKERIRYMAIFLGDPKFEKGGNFPSRPRESVEPAKPK
jgi:hypothetical protein